MLEQPGDVGGVEPVVARGDDEPVVALVGNEAAQRVAIKIP
ncbi:MAG TPA: hypothetical protein VNO82_24755 [Solirubrobacteraceae bacterium]|nr:hypothetical protein [Solirubrobacteraceae bacterium]